MSIPTCEAMVVGTPVVALTSAARRGRAARRPGSWCSGHPAALANAIQRLVDDESLRRRLGDAARQFAARSFDWTSESRGRNRAIDRLGVGPTRPVKP
jgi:glycosyltransferase involved in cell wall biosynthesis